MELSKQRQTDYRRKQNRELEIIHKISLRQYDLIF